MVNTPRCSGCSINRFFFLGLLICLLMHPAFRVYGAEWTSCRGPAGQVGNIFLDPQNPEIVYANANGWIHKSTDNGATWNVISPYDLDLSLWGISPQDSATLYGSMDQSLFISADGSANWRHLKNFGYGQDINAFVIDPRSPDILYIGTGNGAFKSLDGGESWNYINKGLTDFEIRVLVMDPRDSSKLYIGTWGGGVFKSSDGGENWSQIASGLSDRRVLAILVDPLHSGILYVSFDLNGLYKSEDDGETWNRVSFSYTNTILALAMDPHNPMILYAGYYGVAKSTDGGLTWNRMPSGMGNEEIKALLINPEDTQKVYASGHNVYKSANGGVVWNTSGFAEFHSVIALAIDPQNPDIIYAGTAYPGGIYKSAAGCSEFKQIGLQYNRVNAIAIDPMNPSTVYAASDIYVYASNNSGNTWVRKGPAGSLIRSLVIDPDDPAILYAGTNSQGVFKSIDSGATWTAINNGIANLSIYTLSMDPTNRQVLYAGTYEGVYKSIDGGESWIFYGGLTGIGVLGVAIDPIDPDTLYTGGGYKSEDGGLTWISGEGPESTVLALAVNPQDTSIVYAAAEQGFFVSSDSGQTWNNELTDFYTSTLAISPAAPETFYVGAGYFGVLRRSTHPSEPPNLTALDPRTANSGDNAFTLSVYGNRFSKGSIVRWNGAVLATTYISSMYLRAEVPANLLASPGIAQVSVNSDGTITDSFEFAINASVTVTATFNVTPSGLGYSVDGNYYEGQNSFTWVVGSSHFVSLEQMVDNGDVAYIFDRWNDGGSVSHSIIAPSSPFTYEANYITLYRLLRFVSPAGAGRVYPDPDVVPRFYPSGTFVELLAVANSGYSFMGWSGDLTGSDNPQSILMSAPHSVTANFASSAQVSITIGAAPAGREFFVDGTLYSASQTFTWEQGSSHTISVTSPQAGSSGTRYVFANWSDGGAMSHAITVPAAATTYTANYKTQFQLTTTVSPAGGGSIIASPTSGDGYYDAGSSVQLTAIANTGYSFSAWGGSLTGTENPKTFTISAPGSVNATFLSAGRTRPSRLPAPYASRVRIKRVRNSPRE